MPPKFFKTQDLFREWLDKNHTKETELIVGFYKVKSGKESMTWSESVDQALCFGWIDGVRHSIDEESYQIRFTPRKRGSIWSAVNIEKIAKLKEQDLLQPAGIKIYENRSEGNSHVYAFEQKEIFLSEEYEAKFRENIKAWEYFEKLAPSYKKSSNYWVMSAKQEKTRLKRLNELIESSEAGTNKWKDSKYKK